MKKVIAILLSIFTIGGGIAIVKAQTNHPKKTLISPRYRSPARHHHITHPRYR